MIVVNKYSDGSFFLTQGSSLGASIPIVGDVQKILKEARERREPIVERLVR